jgi:hypothetical protein
MLYRPILTVNTMVVSLMTEKELLNNVPSLPRIVDGACLGFFLTAGASTAASTTFLGSCDFVWG